MAQIEWLRVYPLKGLDGIERETAAILDGGTLEHDREFALFDAEGEVLNGKRTDRVHELRTDFDPEQTTLTVVAPSGERLTVDLDDAANRQRAETWFGEYFEEDLTLCRDESLGFVDRRELGPSVISTATLREVASWFEELSVESARRRLRANVEISGVPAFWEDRFVGDDAPAFEANGIRFEGEKACGRCVVPERDPDTGEPTPDFRNQFVTMREQTFPDWADAASFEHYYTLMLIASIPESDRGTALEVGDQVEVIERPA